MATVNRSPKYTFPHTEVTVFDNSAYEQNTAVQIQNALKMLFVVRSPRGVDGQLTTITGGVEELQRKFGQGTFAEYGQPLLNAFAAVGTGYVEATVERICARNAQRANLYVYAAYKVVAADDEPDGPDHAVMNVRFLTAYDNKLIDVKKLASRAEELKPTVPTVTEGVADPDTPDESYEVVFLFAVAAKGRGSYGNDLGLKFVSNDRKDRQNTYKNYTLNILEGNTIIETNSVCLYSGAIYGGKSINAETSVNDPIDGSDNITIVINDTALSTLVEKYRTEVYATLTNKQIYDYAISLGLFNLVSTTDTVEEPDDKHWVVDQMRPLLDLDEANFDAILGVNKLLLPRVSKKYQINDTVPIIGYTIEGVSVTEEGAPANIVMNAIYGNKLAGGTDGEFKTKTNGGTANDDQAVANAISDAYRYAYDPNSLSDLIKDKDKADGEGAIQTPYVRSCDTRIYSTQQFPVNLVMDAGFDDDVKMSIAELIATRGDCFAVFDIGTTIEDKEDILAYGMNMSSYIGSTPYACIDAYYGKIYDPTSKKIITVTSTYELCRNLPRHYNNYNQAKHVPFAGLSYGQMTGFIKDTVYPIMDEDLDAAMMQSFADYRINYAQINQKGVLTRGTQTTLQEELSAMSEMNNALVVLDIKRDAKAMCDGFGFNFFETSDLARFNRACEDLTAKYAAAQVRSISGTFEIDDDDMNNGILHLRIDMVHKKLVKIAMVDINVNRE